jgi:hypothetical protein
MKDVSHPTYTLLLTRTLTPRVHRSTQCSCTSIQNTS